MTADLLPPPEAVLIARTREQPPRVSMTRAARQAGISQTRWRQLENGFRIDHGSKYAEIGPAPTIARMALAVGVTPRQLAEAGRGDAAAELVALLAATMDIADSESFTTEQQQQLSKRIRRDVSDN